MQETILIYNMNDKTKRQRLIMSVLPLKVKLLDVKIEDYGRPIGELLQNNREQETDRIPEKELQGEMIVFAGISGSKLDLILAAFRKNKVPRIPYKAILTATNQNWNAFELLEELQKEHEEFQK